MDENLFFREATLRLCSSLEIDTALKRFYEYIKPFIPVAELNLHIVDFNQNTLRLVALVGGHPPDDFADEETVVTGNEMSP